VLTDDRQRNAVRSERMEPQLDPTAQAELRAFYDVAYDQAWRYLSRITGDRLLTEDLVQDVMVSVARDLVNGRSPRTDGAWIVSVARNRFLNHVRSANRADARVAKATDRSTGFGVPHDTVAAERARDLLLQLPLDQRAAVALRHIDGYSVGEIANLLGRSVEATESLIARGVRMLRRLPAEENES
jgi:RNA polymerase sigma-70 factor, ECF subfamily